MFGPVLLDALSLVDNGSISKRIGKNSRQSYFIVRGNSTRADEYVCLPNFCACMSFSYNVLGKSALMVWFDALYGCCVLDYVTPTACIVVYCSVSIC